MLAREIALTLAFVVINVRIKTIELFLSNLESTKAFVIALEWTRSRAVWSNVTIITLAERVASLGVDFAQSVFAILVSITCWKCRRLINSPASCRSRSTSHRHYPLHVMIHHRGCNF
jgi:hypothetical protein